MDTQLIRPGEPVSPDDLDRIATFLHDHLDQYGDKLEDIKRCLDYALGTEPQHGGFVVKIEENTRILGVVVVNETHMGGYIPENILVYIAVNRDARGKGIGGELMKTTIEHAEGDIALHVEADNPAKKLYERYGFTAPYLEMRYKRDKNA